MFILETKRMLNRKTLGLTFLISLLALYFVQIGINNYKSIIQNKEKFQDIERMKVQQYINYAQYGTYGFRIMFIPSPLSIYFVNSSTISELTSNVDSGERLNIYNSFKGKTLFVEKSGGFKDFSGILLLLGSLLALYSGYESFIYKDYLRFIAGNIDPTRLFAAILLTGLLLCVVFILLNAGLSLLLLKLNGIVLRENDYPYLFIYWGILVLTLIFFFVLGAVSGSFKSRFFGFVVIGISWFVSVFLVPGMVNTVTSRGADNITSNYQLELEKLKILMDFEKQALARRRAVEDREGQTEMELNRKLIESYWQKEVKQIQALEEKLSRETEKNIHRFQALSLLFPSTFYLSVGNEISSKGYKNFIHFFDYIRRLKEGFVRFYIDKRYHSNFAPVESFIKGEKNLFAARDRLPRGVLPGTLLTLVYILGLVALSYARFKKSLRV